MRWQLPSTMLLLLSLSASLLSKELCKVQGFWWRRRLHCRHFNDFGLVSFSFFANLIFSYILFIVLLENFFCIEDEVVAE